MSENEILELLQNVKVLVEGKQYRKLQNIITFIFFIISMIGVLFTVFTKIGDIDQNTSELKKKASTYECLMYADRVNKNFKNVTYNIKTIGEDLNLKLQQTENIDYVGIFIPTRGGNNDKTLND